MHFSVSSQVLVSIEKIYKDFSNSLIIHQVSSIKMIIIIKTENHNREGGLDTRS